jgi:hypothetical protein
MSCPYCGEEVEIWSDEIKAACPRCGRTLMRDGNMSCLEWCSYGRECVGEAIYSDYVEARAAGRKKKLLATLESLFGNADPRTRHARDVLQIAESLIKEEKADPNIVVPASLLHEVGPANGRSAREHARTILLAQGLKKPEVDQVCEIIECLGSERLIDSVNFRVVHDADRLAGIGRGHKSGLLTRSARRIAVESVGSPRRGA